MFKNVKAKKRLTQFMIAFVVICMTLTGSFLLLDDTIDSAMAAESSVDVATAGQWSNAMASVSSGDILNVTLTGDIALTSSTGGKLSAIPAGVTVNLKMNNHSITWSYGTSNDSMDGNVTATSYTSGTYASGEYWGFITNNGTLNVSGTGTIGMNIWQTTTQKEDRNELVQRQAVIVNNGTMTLGQNITVNSYRSHVHNSDDSWSSASYSDAFLYNAAIYNAGGTLNTSAKINAGTMTGTSQDGDASGYAYAFVYGIYGGAVNANGGSVYVDAMAGGFMETGGEQKAQMAAYAVGIYSDTAKLLGNIDINVLAKNWEYQDQNHNTWESGADLLFSAGVLYVGANYPVIGPSVNVTASFEHIGDSKTQVYMPGGTGQYWSDVYSDGASNTTSHYASAVTGVSSIQNCIGAHSSEMNYSAGSYFGETLPIASAKTTAYKTLEAYLGGFNATTSVTAVSNTSNDHTRQTSSLINGAPGNTGSGSPTSTSSGYAGDHSPDMSTAGAKGSQYLVAYRYFDGSVSAANLVDVSFVYNDPNYVRTSASMSIGGATVSNLSGILADTSTKIAYSSGALSRNAYYYEFISKTYETVNVDSNAYLSRGFTGRKPESVSEWNGGLSSVLAEEGDTCATGNVIVVYMNYVLKDPTAIRVVASTSTISQYTETTDFSVKYTGNTLVPGTDFNLGIIDMGIHTDASTNDTDDDTVVTNVYNITGTGSGSGNNATAVTYRYSTDSGSTWTDGLPKDVGEYIIEVNVNADTTFAATGTYNRQGAQGYLTCTITKADAQIQKGGVTIESDNVTATYGDTLATMIPFSNYTAAGVGSDGNVAGTWSYNIAADTYLDAGSHTITLTWTPAAGTTTAKNYNPTSFAVTLLVNKRDVTVATGAANATYGDATATYGLIYTNLAACDDDMKATWLAATDFEVYYNGAWTSYSSTMAAGDYPVRIKTFGGADDVNNNFSIGAESTLTIGKRSIVYNAAATDRAYNGTDVVDVTLTYVSGNTGTDTYDATIATTGTMPAGVNAGEGKVVNVDTSKISLKNSNNYTLVIENATDITVNIAKADPTGVAVVASPDTMTYDSTVKLSAVGLNATSTNVAGSWSWQDATIVPTVDVANYVAVFTPEDQTNYNSITQDVNITVNQKEVVVSVQKYEIAYGDPVPAYASGITYEGFTGTDSLDTIAHTGAIEISGTYSRGNKVGTYPVTVTSNVEATNYYFTVSNSTVVVGPRELTVTANNQSLVYGASTPDLDINDVTVSGFYGSDTVADLSGALTVSTNYTPGSQVGKYSITATGFTSANYDIKYVDGTLEVTKATLTVTPIKQTITYGASVPAYAANGLYTVTGFTVSTDTATTVAITGAPVFSTGYAVGKSVGSYPVTVAVNNMSATNYTFVAAEGTLTVTQATPSIVTEPGATVVNSNLLSTAVFDGQEVVLNPNESTMSVAGTFALENAADEAVYGTDGYYTAIFTPDDTINYTTTKCDVYLTIEAKNISGIPVVQGSAMVTSTLTVNIDAMDPAISQYYTYQWYADDVAITGATGTSYTIQAADEGKKIHVVLTAIESQGFIGNAASDKTAAIIEALLETTAAHLAVTLPSDVTYDASSHAATVAIKDDYASEKFGSIVIKYNGSTTAPTAAGTYIVTVDVGTPSSVTGTGYDDGYTYHGPASGINVGSFEIKQAPYTVQVDAIDKVYDGTTTANANITGSGAFELDDVYINAGVKFAFEDANVGTDKKVSVTSMSLGGAQAANYYLDIQEATADITPATLKARVTATNKVYDTSATVGVTFTVDRDSYVVVDSASTVYITNGSATAASADAGTHNLLDITYTLAGSSAGNYVLEITNENTATVIISPAPSNVTAPVITGVEYDSAKTLQTVDLAPYTDVNGFWQFDDLTIVPTVSTTQYAATYYSTNKNYANAQMNVTIIVTPKAVTLTADDKAVTYGSKAPNYTITAKGLTGSDTLADIGGTVTAVCTYAAGSDIGSYQININNALSDDNYTFTTVPGSLTVSRARLNVTATAADKVYDGTTDIDVTFAITSGKYATDDVSLNTTYIIGKSATPNAGPTTVTYTRPTLVGEKADNYEIYITPASGSLRVNISKADVQGVIFPSEATVQYGYTLAFAEFATAGVGDGTFVYENAATTVPAALGLYTNYKVIFTPTDNRNYNSQEAYVSLHVVKCELDYIVGIAGETRSGETLKIATTGLPDAAMEFMHIQWYRSDGTTIEAIDKATGVSYVATDEDVGYTLIVFTYFTDEAPFYFGENADIEEDFDGDNDGILGQTSSTIEEVNLTFWQRFINWLYRIIAAITGMQLGTAE